MPFGLQLAHAIQDIDHPRNQSETSRNDDDEKERVARDYKHRKPRGKASVFRIGLTPVADAQCDDAAQKQTFVRNWIEIHSERAALVIPACNVPVETVAYGRKNKNNDRRETLPLQRIAAFDALAIINRHRHKS